MIYTLSLFNTGQVTLPKQWRSKFRTKKFVAKEMNGGLLIQPLLPDEEHPLHDNNVEYFEDKNCTSEIWSKLKSTKML